IRMQLSVERYAAIDVGRGANLDTIDMPLNSRSWLKAQFAGIRALPQEADRLEALDALVRRTDPGPGGFYDDLGAPGRQPHLVAGAGFAADPAMLHSIVMGCVYRPDAPFAWWTYAEPLQDAPLRLRYTGLDPGARYRVRVVYAGEGTPVRIRLVANGSIEVHPYRLKELPARPLEFDLPEAATRGGTLELAWSREPGLGGNGRGCQVAEVFLIKR